MDAQALKEQLVRQARSIGFAAAGVAGVEPFHDAATRAHEAIDGGRMSGMDWYTHERVAAASDLPRRYPWARSLLALAWPYRPARAPADQPPAGAPGRPRGRIASYALITGDEGAADYHSLLAARCDQLVAWLRVAAPGLRAKRFIDHGWAMDRPVAERAGIGFAGKHASLITREAGSYVLLAEILLSVELPADSESPKGCGRCRACLPACPTGAILEPGVIDARRCISYLTIEHRGPIPLALRPLLGTWAFGCDLCQEACPINHRLAPAPLEAGEPSTSQGPVPFPDLVECLQLTEEEFESRFRRTSLWRTGRPGLARNCAVALGNAGDAAAVPALAHAQATDPDAAVRDAAGWALARLGGGAA